MVADALAPCVARSSAPMILCKMGKSLSSIRSDFNYLCHISMEKWYCKYMFMILLKNLACKVLLISVPIDIMAHDDSMASAGTMLTENCILLEIKLTTKTMAAAGTATTTTSTTITTTTTNCKMMSVITNRSGFTKFGGTFWVLKFYCTWHHLPNQPQIGWW